MSYDAPKSLTLIFLGKVNVELVFLSTGAMQALCGEEFSINMQLGEKNRGPFKVFFNEASKNEAMVSAVDELYEDDLENGDVSILKEYDTREDHLTINIICNDYS